MPEQGVQHVPAAVEGQLPAQVLDGAVVVRFAGGFQLLDGVVEPLDVTRVVFGVVDSQRPLVIERFEGIVVVGERGQAIGAVLVRLVERAAGDQRRCRFTPAEPLVHRAHAQNGK